MNDEAPPASEQPPEKEDQRKFNGSKPGERRKKGHQVTDGTRLNVSLMVSAGIARETVAFCIGISLATLQKKYKKELTGAKAEITKKAMGQLALGIGRGNMTAVIFWLKTQAGFREGTDLNLNGLIPVKIVDDVPDPGE